jgi:hypothetical protein
MQGLNDETDRSAGLAVVIGASPTTPRSCKGLPDGIGGRRGNAPASTSAPEQPRDRAASALPTVRHLPLRTVTATGQPPIVATAGLAILGHLIRAAVVVALVVRRTARSTRRGAA